LRIDKGEWRIEASYRVSAGAGVILTAVACAEPVEVQRIVWIVPRQAEMNEVNYQLILKRQYLITLPFAVKSFS
jgi:hypothetical protein